MKTLFIGGWGIGVDRYAGYFSSDTTVMHPSSEAELEVRKGEAEVYVAYSLGSLILLNNREFLEGKEVRLIAPFCDFVGQSFVSEVQLKYMERWVRVDALGAVNDFYKRAGMDMDEIKEIPYCVEDMLWGLEYLRTKRVEGGEYEGVLGADDKLLRVEEVMKCFNNVAIVEGCGHCFRELGYGI